MALYGTDKHNHSRISRMVHQVRQGLHDATKSNKSSSGAQIGVARAAVKVVMPSAGLTLSLGQKSGEVAGFCMVLGVMNPTSTFLVGDDFLSYLISHKTTKTFTKHLKHRGGTHPNSQV